MKLRYKIASSILIFVGLVIATLGFTLSYTKDCEPASAVAAGVELMKAVQYRCYGSPDVLEYTDVAKPSPADDEVLVKIHAASVNPLDWHFMRGSPYFMRLMSGIGAPEYTGLGVDFAGTIEAVGKDVTRFRPGDEVFGEQNGAFAEYLTIGEREGLALKPTNITFAQAAAVPVAGVTALQALRDVGKLEPGQKVLINGASGGVGTFAVQIAKALGAEVTGVCSSRNEAMVRSLGADFVIDYRQANYTEGEERYDLIVDMIGNHSLLANRSVLKPDGRMVIVGGPKGNWFGPMMAVFSAMIVSPFVDQEMGMMIANIDADTLTPLVDLMQRGDVTPQIDRVYPLSGIRDAIQYSEEGHARGKIIIE